jgi:hypothetical protein
MEKWLDEHPLISLTGIEFKLGITHGVLRRGKPVPEKYRDAVRELLRSYGYEQGVVIPIEDKVSVMPLREEGYVVKRVRKLGIGECAYFIGKMEGGIFKRDNGIEDGSEVIKKSI